MVAKHVGRSSLVIAALSTVVEWYDFTLYIYFSTVLARVFFPGSEASLLATLGGFAVAYLARPLGALGFAHIGDRHGRRPMLLLSMAIMSAAMLVTALLPTPSSVGPIAAYLLVTLRCIMGFAVGGEYTGVVAYLLESAPAERRGLVASLAAAASEVGALLAVAICALTVSVLPEAQLEAWGWRIPFLVGALLAGAVWFARSAMAESPDFERQRDTGALPERPLAYAISTYRRGIANGFAISALGSITYYVGATYVSAFLTSVGGMSEAAALWLSTGAAIAIILVTPVAGLLSDQWGRKPVLLTLTALSVALPFGMFWLLATGDLVQAVPAAIVLALIAGGVSAVGAVATAEQFAGEGRVSGLALGSSLATAIFGGLTPYLAQLLTVTSGLPQFPGVMIAFVALCVLPVFARLRETQPGLARV